MIVVIGHYPEYLDTAATLDAAVFNVLTAEWGRSMMRHGGTRTVLFSI